jgi:hypothetical protein
MSQSHLTKKILQTLARTGSVHKNTMIGHTVTKAIKEWDNLRKDCDRYKDERESYRATLWTYRDKLAKRMGIDTSAPAWWRVSDERKDIIINKKVDAMKGALP